MGVLVTLVAWQSNEGNGDSSNSPQAECPPSFRPPVAPHNGTMSLRGTDKLSLKVPS